MKKLSIAILVAAITLAGCQGKDGANNAATPAGAATQITGAGSTFVYPVLSAWSADYSQQHGAKIP